MPANCLKGANMRMLLFGLLLSLCTITVAISPAAPGEDTVEERSSPARVTNVGGVIAKIFDSWDGAMVLGDCNARNAKLTLYENGGFEWEVELMSIDINDEWYQSFEFYDGPPPGGTSFGKREGGRFDIKLKNTWRSWRRRGRSSPDPKLAAVFERIQTVRWTAGC